MIDDHAIPLPNPYDIILNYIKREPDKYFYLLNLISLTNNLRSNCTLIRNNVLHTRQENLV